MEQERRVRFRVASARSGRVLREVYREQEEGTEDSMDSDTAAGSEPERAISPTVGLANGHLSGLKREGQRDSGSEADDLLVYASKAHQQLFNRKRVNIFSKNGTVRGVRDKVSAGQVLFNGLANLYGGSLQGNSPKTP